MTLPTKLPELKSEDGSGSKPPDDQLAAELSHANPIARARILAGGYIARHPTLLRVLEWLGWDNPGGRLNPEAAARDGGPFAHRTLGIAALPRHLDHPAPRTRDRLVD